MANTLRFIYWQLVHLLFSNSKSPVRKGLEKRKLPSNFLIETIRFWGNRDIHKNFKTSTRHAVETVLKFLLHAIHNFNS